MVWLKARQTRASKPYQKTYSVHPITPLLSKLAGHCLDRVMHSLEPSQMVITDIRGGMEVTNVTQENSKSCLNVRNSTRQHKVSVTYVDGILQGLDYTWSFQSAKPFVIWRLPLIVKAVWRNTFYNRIHQKLSTTGGTLLHDFWRSLVLLYYWVWYPMIPSMQWVLSYGWCGSNWWIF